ncbi:MAG TPA: type II toxin-antitoxin system RelE/ParE family toxin [Salinimicrobium sp.]|nr:type II toxin-antitoxin system RelE/ParE family toxin [Salinimicrobium sp.]
MSYSVKSISKFEKHLKKLSKKYPSLKTEYIQLIQILKEYPKQGTPIGRNCYKIRLSIASKGKGKSGGGRVIINIVMYTKTVYLLSIFDKSDKESLTDKELKELLALVPE